MIFTITFFIVSNLMPFISHLRSIAWHLCYRKLPMPLNHECAGGNDSGGHLNDIHRLYNEILANVVSWNAMISELDLCPTWSAISHNRI